MKILYTHTHTANIKFSHVLVHLVVHTCWATQHTLTHATAHKTFRFTSSSLSFFFTNRKTLSQCVHGVRFCLFGFIFVFHHPNVMPWIVWAAHWKWNTNHVGITRDRKNSRGSKWRFVKTADDDAKKSTERQSYHYILLLVYKHWTNGICTQTEHEESGKKCDINWNM